MHIYLFVGEGEQEGHSESEGMIYFGANTRQGFDQAGQGATSHPKSLTRLGYVDSHCAKLLWNVAGEVRAGRGQGFSQGPNTERWKQGRLWLYNTYVVAGTLAENLVKNGLFFLRFLRHVSADSRHVPGGSRAAQEETLC